jgi:hypothetical protein
MEKVDGRNDSTENLWQDWKKKVLSKGEKELPAVLIETFLLVLSTKVVI